MEGTGKTHLARCICTDCQVLEIFDNIIWVNVSDDFDLDGVGRYDCDDWEALRAVFQHGMSGNGILVTTHEHSVARAMESSYIFCLGKLSNELCWMILREVGLNDDTLEYAVDDLGRRCLSYWAIFPKSFEISKTFLVQHWMAQGYLYSFDNLEMELKADLEVKVVGAHHLIMMIAQGAGFPMDISGAKKLRTLVTVT
ncbi:Disease resistance protein [Gossypium australe]|uniref:Disease resistance protein n=1 Tax=Gossypium australe TaxID=47621 RepID=A0A5B6VT24_9ROSI|nr:Disease resistance protein [Gossypium australe]